MKYNSEHKRLNCDCLQSDIFEGKNITAFRLVHKDLDHENNFKPAFLINPSRLQESDSCKKKCSGYGLSFFTNEKKAEKKLQSLVKLKPNFKKIVGNSIAKGEISEKDGVCNKSNNQGHFTLHESVNSDIKAKFELVKTDVV